VYTATTPPSFAHDETDATTGACAGENRAPRVAAVERERPQSSPGSR
jgi:hypothetical protein